MQPLPRLFRLAVLVALPCSIFASHPRPASAGPVPFEWGTTFGPAFAAGEGSGRLENGRAMAIEMLAREPSRNAWLVRAGLWGFDRGPGNGRNLQFWSGGRAYLPAEGSGAADDALRLGTLEVGLRRVHRGSRARAYVQGTTGVGWIREHFAGPSVVNDRRPDLSSPPVPVTHSALTPTFAVSAGVFVHAPLRTALQASIGATWTAVSDLTGPTLPILVGARWPVPAEAASSSLPGSAGPRLRFSAGQSALRNPGRLRPDVAAAPAFGMEIDVPFARRFAMSFAAEHSVARFGARIPIRQEVDPYGNLVTVVDGTQPLSLTTTTLTAGVRAATEIGRLMPSLRAGVGWGRTGGFGRTVTTTSGAYLDEYGQWVPVTSRVEIGGGSPTSGFAWTCAAAVETPLGRSLGLFAEVAATQLVLRGDDVLMLPYRAGLVLR